MTYASNPVASLVNDDGLSLVDEDWDILDNDAADLVSVECAENAEIYGEVLSGDHSLTAVYEENQDLDDNENAPYMGTMTMADFWLGFDPASETDEG